MAETPSGTTSPAGTDAEQARLEPKRMAGRAWVLTKMGTFAATLVCLFLHRPLAAALFLSASLAMGFWASFKLQLEDIERPLALFWLELGEKLLGNLIFLAIFLNLLWDPNETFPTMLCAGLITLTLRNLFYLIFSIALLKEHRELPLKTIW